MSQETEAVDEVLAAIEAAISPDRLGPQEAANVLAEVAAQVDAQLTAMKELDGVEPE